MKLTDRFRVTPKIADTIGAKRLPTRRQKEGFVFRFPLRILAAVVKANSEKALPLIMAVDRQLHMTRRQETPLNGAIWDAAGNPTAKKRDTMLRNLKRLPHIMRLRIKRTTVSRYVVSRGPLWDEAGQE